MCPERNQGSFDKDEERIVVIRGMTATNKIRRQINIAILGPQKKKIRTDHDTPGLSARLDNKK